LRIKDLTEFVSTILTSLSQTSLTSPWGLPRVPSQAALCFHKRSGFVPRKHLPRTRFHIQPRHSRIAQTLVCGVYGAPKGRIGLCGTICPNSASGASQRIESNVCAGPFQVPPALAYILGHSLSNHLQGMASPESGIARFEGPMVLTASRADGGHDWSAPIACFHGLGFRAPCQPRTLRPLNCVSPPAAAIWKNV